MLKRLCVGSGTAFTGEGITDIVRALPGVASSLVDLQLRSNPSPLTRRSAALVCLSFA
jgi:hypothetical protein